MESRHEHQPSAQDMLLPDLPLDTGSIWDYDETPEPTPSIPVRRRSDSPRPRPMLAQELTYSEETPAIPLRRRTGTGTTRPRPSREPAHGSDDVVMSIAPAATIPAPARRPRTAPAPSRQRSTSTPFVLPPLRSLLDQALPSLVMVVTALGVAALGPLSILGIPLWALAAAVPALAFLALANEVSHPVWSHSSLVNVAILFAVFPVLVVRQSVSRIPYIDWSSGTLAAPMVMTLVLLGALTGVGLLAAYLCREDPEYAGVVFLPAAMLVPFFAGSSSITNLHTAMLMVAGIYLVTALLTVVAFVAPPSISGLMGPVAIMIQFLVLAGLRGADIFPVGSGVSSRVLFFLAVAGTVALTILVPMASYWMRQVMLLVRTSDRSSAATA
ncbi:MAG: hypothetical protein QM753_07095 [Thermomicrobiales bacterium]